jgi:DNA-binding response OmpR family regulator
MCLVVLLRVAIAHERIIADTGLGRRIMHILVVEDDEHVSEALSYALTQHGHTVTWVSTGTDALRKAADAEFVLLDLGLPDLDGYEVCRRIRSGSSVPIIAVTARTDEIDRVVLLRGGADDYIVKPCGIHELLARIEAVARRSGGAVPAGDADPDSTQEIGSLVIDRRARKVTVDGDAVKLTVKEFDLLAELAADAGAVQTREVLIDRVWDENWHRPTRTLDVHIGTLRAKLGNKQWIETVRGVGFRLRPP